MKQHRPELADVFRTHQSDFLARWNSVLSRQQRKALRDIRDCRTAALGGHVRQCDRCGHRVVLYDSCRNRHCPKCQATARAKWLAEREAELLSVPYFHVVFTLPQQIGHIALQNPRQIYNILFRAASQTLLEVAADPRLPGALHRLPRGAAHLGSESASPSPLALRRAGVEASRPMAPAGSPAARTLSFFPIVSSATDFARSSWGNCDMRSSKAPFASPATSDP